MLQRQEPEFKDELIVPVEQDIFRVSGNVDGRRNKSIVWLISPVQSTNGSETIPHSRARVPSSMYGYRVRASHPRMISSLSSLLLNFKLETFLFFFLQIRLLGRRRAARWPYSQGFTFRLSSVCIWLLFVWYVVSVCVSSTLTHPFTFLGASRLLRATQSTMAFVFQDQATMIFAYWYPTMTVPFASILCRRWGSCKQSSSTLLSTTVR